MPKAIYLLNAVRNEIDAPVGTSLMRGACDNGVEGIIGDCGGNMSCATCHVFVDDEFLHLLSPVSSSEDQMLDYTAAPRQPNSRLSCQLFMSEALNGLTVTIADPQL